jgi:RecD/TraA family predicted helicase
MGDEGSAFLEGSLESVTFHNEENGYTIARLRTFDREIVTIVGAFINPILGESLYLSGRWETHKQYGLQFRVEHYRIQKPATAAAMEKYLGSGLIKGIGEKMAKQLVDYFGLETIDIIENAPQRLSEVPGIGEKKARAITEAWDAHREVRHIMLFLQGHGISATYAAKIHRQYGDQAIEIVSKNPYQLANDVMGIGFKLADRIAGQLGFAADTPERIEAGVLYCLREATDQGHCFLPEEALAKGTAELLAAPLDEKMALTGPIPTIDAAGNYAAPASVATTTVCHVVATSSADTGKSGTAAVTISPNGVVTVAVAPSTVTARRSTSRAPWTPPPGRSRWWCATSVATPSGFPACARRRS